MSYPRIEIVKDIVKQAGEIALGHFGNIPAGKKADESLVTAADVEAGEFINRQLRLNFPEYGIINEELEQRDPEIYRKKQYVWVVDPIDGTASYSSRMPVWGPAVGLLKGLTPVLGVFYMPLLDEIYYTDENMPAFFESRRWGKIKMDLDSVSSPIGSNSLLLSVSYTHRRLNVDFPGKVRSLGSTSAHVSYVARGDATGAIVKGSLWDLVPGMAILKKSGGSYSYLDDSPIDLSQLMRGEPTKKFALFTSPGYKRELGNMINTI